MKLNMILNVTLQSETFKWTMIRLDVTQEAAFARRGAEAGKRRLYSKALAGPRGHRHSDSFILTYYFFGVFGVGAPPYKVDAPSRKSWIHHCKGRAEVQETGRLCYKGR